MLVCGAGKLGQLGKQMHQSKVDEDTEETKIADLAASKVNIDNEQFEPVPRFYGKARINIKSMGCGKFHFMVVAQDGRAFAWGFNKFGQLGLGRISKYQEEPDLVEVQSSAKERVVFESASCGEIHSILITDKGELYSCGSSQRGILGIGQMKSMIAIHTPKKVKNFEKDDCKFKQVSCGINHNLALSEDGVIYAWGGGWDNKLGTGSKQDQHQPVRVKYDYTTKFRKVSAGTYHSLALTEPSKVSQSEGGLVYHWGHRNATGSKNENLFPEHYDALSTLIKDIAAGDMFSLAINDESEIYGWGMPKSYRLGEAVQSLATEGQTSSATTIIVRGGRSAKAISVGYTHCAALCDPSELFTWGSMSNGRCGQKYTGKEWEIKNPSPVTSLQGYLSTATSKQAAGKQTKGSKTKETSAKDDPAAKNLNQPMLAQLGQMLYEEPEERNEDTLVENDKQTKIDFDELLERFRGLSNEEGDDNLFNLQLQDKLLQRMRSLPFKIQGMRKEPAQYGASIDRNLKMFSNLITIFQLHPCYVHNFLRLQRIDYADKIRALNVIYGNMINDQRLIIACVYLAKMILRDEINDTTTPDQILKEDPENRSIFRYIFHQIMLASVQDLTIVRKITSECVKILHKIIGDDKFGILTNPKEGNDAQLKTLNEMAAFVNNQRNVKKRCKNLETVLDQILKYIGRLLVPKQHGMNADMEFSSAVRYLLRSIRSLSQKKHPGAVDNREEMNLLMELIFRFVVEAILNPLKFYIVFEVGDDEKSSNKNKNFTQLSETLSLLFKGQEMQKQAWLEGINDFISKRARSQKEKILQSIMDKPAEIEGDMLFEIFQHSLSSFPVTTSVNYKELCAFQNQLIQYQDKVKVSSTSYDAIVLILDRLESPPNSRKIKDMCINLSLQTRILRREQSLVRCPICRMVIPREMAPNFHEQIFEMFEPLASSNPISILTEILRHGPKRSEAQTIKEYLKSYRQYCANVKQDKKTVQMIDDIKMSVKDKINTEIEEIQMQPGGDEKSNIRKRENFIYSQIEEQCLKQYYARQNHYDNLMVSSKLISKIKENLKQENKQLTFDEKEKYEYTFNIEYGCANRELAEFADEYMKPIFYNTIRKRVKAQPVANSLYENIGRENKDMITGYARYTVQSLLKKKPKILKAFCYADTKRLEMTFSPNNEGVNVTCVRKQKPSYKCGTSEFSSDKLLFMFDISIETIFKLRQSPEETWDQEIEGVDGIITFNRQNLLNRLEKIDAGSIAYKQNIVVGEEEIALADKEVMQDSKDKG